ncbi:hypothetical protein [Alishewanella aestuarii]|nr:hypothetical protein [Alishewanella aestuarii]
MDFIVVAAPFELTLVEEKHEKIKKLYDSGLSPLDEISEIASQCLKLIANLKFDDYGSVGNKNYICYHELIYSRPIATELFISDPEEFEASWLDFIEKIDSENCSCQLEVLNIDRIIYTAIMSFAICYDIWKNSSRKTPGTHFEILLGSIFSRFFINHNRGKHISLPDGESLSTDICFSNKNEIFVFPAKTTTRERIVQPYAHQRILDSISPGQYRSILLCVSETQRDNKKKKVNDICVPGTIKLYQEHLSKLTGIYYLDPPVRYLSQDILKLVKVGSIGELLKSDLSNIIKLNQVGNE